MLFEDLIIGRNIYLRQKAIEFRVYPFFFSIQSPYKKFRINRLQRDIASANPLFTIRPICQG